MSCRLYHRHQRGEGRGPPLPRFRRHRRAPAPRQPPAELRSGSERGVPQGREGGGGGETPAAPRSLPRPPFFRAPSGRARPAGHVAAGGGVTWGRGGVAARGRGAARGGAERRGSGGPGARSGAVRNEAPKTRRGARAARSAAAFFHNEKWFLIVVFLLFGGRFRTERVALPPKTEASILLHGTGFYIFSLFFFIFHYFSLLSF